MSIATIMARALFTKLYYWISYIYWPVVNAWFVPVGLYCLMNHLQIPPSSTRPRQNNVHRDLLSQGQSVDHLLQDPEVPLATWPGYCCSLWGCQLNWICRDCFPQQACDSKNVADVWGPVWEKSLLLFGLLKLLFTQWHYWALSLLWVTQ